MSKGWDNATLKKLKSLTGKGLSTAEIGKRLGMSKNAIVGKLNRLGWNLKAGGVDVVIDKASEKKAKTSVVIKKAAPAKKSAAVVKVPKKVVPVKAVVVKKPVPVSAAKKLPVPVKAKAVTKLKAKPIAEKVSVKESKTSNKNLAMHQRIIQHSLGMAGLRTDQCRWPIGDPDSENFHFCGDPVFVGKPYCYEHCKQAYQFVPQKKKSS